MTTIDFVCRDCGLSTQRHTRVALEPEQKRCQSCGSANVRQTLASYLRNGALSDPACGAPQVIVRGYG